MVSSYYKIMIYLRESQGANPIGKALVKKNPVLSIS